MTKPHEQQAEHLKERAVESDKVTQKKVEERENVAHERVEERENVAQKRIGESETVAPKRVAERETMAQKRMEEKGNIQPLTLEQLNSLYYNPKLEQNDTFIDNFIEVSLEFLCEYLFCIIFKSRALTKMYLSWRQGLN